MVCCPCVTKLMEFQEFKEMCMNSAREFGRHAPKEPITCPVKDEFLPLQMLREGTSGTWSNCTDGESGVRVAPSILSLDPFALENQTDTKMMCPRDPLGESDESGEEDFAETKCNEEAAVFNESKQLLMDDQGEVKSELELTEEVGNVEIHSREVIDDGDSSDTGGPILLSDILAIMGMVDHCNNIGGLPGEVERESDELEADRQGISQNQARDNHSYDPVHEENLQLEYSLANSYVVTENREKKQKKNIKLNNSSNKFSQLNDSARFIGSHECEQLCHQVKNTRYPTEYICNYCSAKYSEKKSLALHIIRHVDGKKLTSVLPEKYFSPRLYQNLLVKNRGNTEPVTLETSNISFSRKSSGRKNSSYPSEYLCNYCHTRFSEKNSLALHIKIHVDGMRSASVLPKKDFQPRLSQNVLVKDQGNFESVIVEPFNISVTQKISKRKNEKPADEDSSGGENLGKELCNPSKFLFKSVKPREKALVKAIKCNECGKIFNKKGNLRRHSRIHSGLKPYKCNECEKTFTTRGALNNHLVVHTGVKRFKCNECGKMFNRSDNLRVHLLIHTGVKPFKFNECEKTFPTSSHLNKHSVVHTGVKRFKCNECGKMFTRKNNLKTHLLVHTGVKPFKCNDCGKMFRTRSDLNKHSVVHTGVKRFKCNDCGKMFNQSTNLRTHSRIHSGVKLFKCNECGKMFTNSSNLRRHLLMHTGVKPFKFNECEKTFPTSSNLNKHSVVHTGVKRFKCNECGKMFTRKNTLKTHLLAHTGVKPFKCNDCGKMFNQSSHLRTHSRIHSGVKLFKCNECGKMFATSGELKSHSLVHTGLKRFKCNECGKMFARSGELKSHSFVHTGVKRFKCNECGKMFARSGELKSHSLVHTGVKRFKCNECGKMFARSGDLKSHSLVHTGVKPFRCNECGKVFNQSSLLRIHWRIHSGVMPFQCDVCRKQFKWRACFNRHLLHHADRNPSK